MEMRSGSGQVRAATDRHDLGLPPHAPTVEPPHDLPHPRHAHAHLQGQGLNREPRALLDQAQGFDLAGPERPDVEAVGAATGVSRSSHRQANGLLPGIVLKQPVRTTF